MAVRSAMLLLLMRQGDGPRSGRRRAEVRRFVLSSSERTEGRGSGGVGVSYGGGHAGQLIRWVQVGIVVEESS